MLTVSNIFQKKLIGLLFLLVPFFPHAQDLQHIWSSKIANPNTNVGISPRDIVIDQHNNKYICGKFSGTHDFDPGPGVYNMTALNNTSYSTVYVMKLDSLNNFVWANSYGSTGSIVWAYGLVVDSAGSVYTYGYYEGNLFYNPPSSMTVSPFWWYSDAYVHKLDSDGNFEWIKSWGANAADGIMSMQIDEDQNFYVLGFYSDSTDVDPGPGTYIVDESNSASGRYLAKYDPDFNLLWASQYDGTGIANATFLSLEADEITITGRYQGIIDFDMNGGTDIDTAFSYNNDMFVHVMDRSGNHKWHHTIKASGDQGNGVCVTDSKKNRYVHGSFGSTMNFNPDGVPNIIEFLPQSSNYTDSYIIKLDSSGNQLWAKAIQGKGVGEIQGLKMQSDQLIVFGQAEAKTDIDPNSGIIMLEPPLMINGLLYIEKLDSNANVLWHEEFLCSNQLTFTDFELDLNNNYFFTGQLFGNVDIDPGPNVVELSHDNGSAEYLALLGELPCSQLGTDLSFVVDATCSTTGGVTASGVYGNPPYSYTWLTNPPSSNPNFVTDTSGLYFVRTTDASGCADTNSVYIDGPGSGSPLDLDVNLVTSTFIQGQPAMLWVDAHNSGCQQVTGTIMLVLDPLIHYDSCSVTPTSISGDTLFWNLDYGNSDSSHFMATVFATTSQTAISGDTVCFLARVNPFSGDADTLNNEKAFCEPILASYDPNDKKVFPKGLCEDHVYMGEALTYTIRFQNTGNSEAIHVNIIDTLDTGLDLSTFKVIAQSHPGLFVNYMGARELQFNFQNIHLPDSASDPAGSNGYVIFKISPREEMAVNSKVSNEVNIFFDFNSPILTNTVTTTFTNDIPCIHTDDLDVFEIEASDFAVYPNPAEDKVTFLLSNGQQRQLNVYSPMGTLLLTKEIVNGSILSVKDLPNGLYLLKVEGYGVVKIVKQ